MSFQTAPGLFCRVLVSFYITQNLEGVKALKDKEPNVSDVYADYSLILEIIINDEILRWEEIKAYKK